MAASLVRIGMLLFCSGFLTAIISGSVYLEDVRVNSPGDTIDQAPLPKGRASFNTEKVPFGAYGVRWTWLPVQSFTVFEAPLEYELNPEEMPLESTKVELEVLVLIELASEPFVEVLRKSRDMRSWPFGVRGGVKADCRRNWYPSFDSVRKQEHTLLRLPFATGVTGGVSESILRGVRSAVFTVSPWT